MMERSTTNPNAKTALSLIAICGAITFFTIQFINNSDINILDNVSKHLVPISSSSSFTNNNINNLRQTPTNNHRRLSLSLPNGGCEITWPKKPAPGTAITYAASYPGCGARMTWNLVEALTGLETGDDWNNNGRGEEVITVKTHYPQSNGILVDFDEKIQRGFIVVRNPMKSIPSFFNHIYEMRNHLPVHSERAPVDEWIKWRNAYIDTEIAEYKKFIFYWMDRYAAADRLLITYEGLTDDVIGPEVTKTLNEFLGRVDGVTPIDESSVACVWRAVVKNEPPAQQAEKFKALQEVALKEQLDGGAVASEAAVAPVAAVQAPVAINPQPAAAQLTPEQINVINQDPAAEVPVAAAIPQQTAAIPQQIAPMQQTSTQQLAPIQQTTQQIAPMQQTQPQVTQQFAPMQQTQQIAPMQQETLPLGQSSTGIQDLEAQILAAQQALAEGQQLIDQQQQQTPGLRRRLDPGHHNSQRAGPVQPRPYTPEQLDKMMAMLMEVADKYNNTEDIRVYHIMTKYYNEIKVEREKLNGAGELPPEPAGGFF